MTEKNYNPEQKTAKTMKVQKTAAKKKVEVAEQKKEIKENKIEETNEKTERNETEGKKENKKPIQKSPVIKKAEVSVNAKSVRVSTKYSIEICRFIKGKKIDEAMEYLEQVQRLRKAVPMRGEYAHRKGKMMSGKFPKAAAGEFIPLLKSLKGNANFNDIDEPVISAAIANRASQPLGRFGRWQRKRTHITLKAKSGIKRVKDKKENKEKKK